MNLNSREKKMIHAAEQNRPDVVQKREEWKKFLEETDATKLFFLDESGVNNGLTRNYGRSRGKERVKDSVPFNRPVRTTIVSGIRLNGNCAIQTMDGAMNAERFKEYVEKILCPALKPGDIVVMDNLSAHKVQGIKELIEGVGAEVKYLPPYSPEFNPIDVGKNESLSASVENTNQREVIEGCYRRTFISRRERLSRLVFSLWVRYYYLTNLL